jgi:hypothetical protein
MLQKKEVALVFIPSAGQNSRTQEQNDYLSSVHFDVLNTGISIGAVAVVKKKPLFSRNFIKDIGL